MHGDGIIIAGQRYRDTWCCMVPVSRFVSHGYRVRALLLGPSNNPFSELQSPWPGSCTGLLPPDRSHDSTFHVDGMGAATRVCIFLAAPLPHALCPCPDGSRSPSQEKILPGLLAPLGEETLGCGPVGWGFWFLCCPILPPGPGWVWGLTGRSGIEAGLL